MLKFIKKIYLLFLFLTLISTAALAQGYEWIQFRGPERLGQSPEKLQIDNWEEVNLESNWLVDVGSGFSEVLVKGDKLYTMISDTIDSITGSEYLVSYQAADGKELWRVKIDSLYFDPDGWGNGTRATPYLDGDKIYCFSGFGKLSAHQLNDGRILWQKDFAALYKSTEPRWGFASSPLVVGDLLIMEAGGTEGKAFIALNKENGEIVWNYGKGNASFNSPVLANINGQDQILFANGYTLYSFKPDGDTLWTFKMPFGGIITVPLLVEDNRIFLSGIRNPGFVIVEVSDNQPKELIRGNSMKTDFNTSVYHDGYIYGFHVAALRCISAETGEVKWTKRGYGKGSLILVDGHLFVLSDKGKLAVVEATPDTFTEKANIQAMEGKSWTAPGFSNRKIYLRNLSQMTCIEIR